MRIGQQRQRNVVSYGIYNSAVTHVLFDGFVGNSDIYRKVAALVLVEVDAQAHVIQQFRDDAGDVFVGQNVVLGRADGVVYDFAQSLDKFYQQLVRDHQSKALGIQIDQGLHEIADRGDLIQIHIYDRIRAADGRVHRSRSGTFVCIAGVAGVSSYLSIVVQFGNDEYLFHDRPDSRIQIQIVQAEEQLRIEQFDARVSDVIRQSHADQILTHIFRRSVARVVHDRIAYDQIDGQGSGYFGCVLRVQQSVQVYAYIHGQFAYQRLVAARKVDTCIETFGSFQSQHSEDYIQQIGDVQVTVLQVYCQTNVRARRQSNLGKVRISFSVLYRNDGIQRAGFAHFLGNGGVYVLDVDFHGLTQNADAQSHARIVGLCGYLPVFVQYGFTVIIVYFPFLFRGIQVYSDLIF